MLNHCYGEKRAVICDFRPSSAQARVLASLRERAADLVRQCSSVDLDGQEIQKILRVDFGDYRGLSAVRPLGVRAGVPESAATVDAAALLSDWDPVLASQCEDPSALLLPLSKRPEMNRKKCVYLDKSYPQLVEKAHSVGLVDMLLEEELARVNGEANWNGGFSVDKDEFEDRWICPLELSNDNVDDSKLCAVAFP